MSKNKDIVDEFLDYKKNIIRCSEHTIRAYQSDLNQYLKFLSKEDVSLLNSHSNNIQSYLHKLGKKNITSNSMARKLASIKSLYKYLAGNKIIPTNIARSIKSPKTPKRFPNFLTVKTFCFSKDNFSKDDMSLIDLLIFSP